jgi:integrase
MPAPSLCSVCARNRVAWSKPNPIAFCYACMPGGPRTPPPCRRCGAGPEHFFSADLCVRCHPSAPQVLDACRDCDAWGVERKHKWLCWGCRAWRVKFPPGSCAICRRERPLRNEICRRCYRQTVIVNHLAAGNWRGTTSPAQANRHGQQLEIANLHSSNHQPARHAPAPLAPARAPAPFRPVAHRQLTLFEATRVIRLGTGTLLNPPVPQMAAYLDRVAVQCAAEHGWSSKTLKRARRGLEVVQCLQDTPGAQLTASEIAALEHVQLGARAVTEICQAAGLWEDDRIPAVVVWFERQVAHLPEPMVHELREWLEVMVGGSRTPPRRRPRDQVTIRIQLRWALPALTAWARAGCDSLRQISRDQLLATLPPAGNPRSTIAAGLRSIFTVLRARRLIFTNPLRGLRIGPHVGTAPTPADLQPIREALESPDPARALLAALAAFHGLAPGELRHLNIADIRGTRLHLSDRTILLADPVRVRLSAYLRYRSRQWPNTANPHLFVNQRSALRTTAPGAQWLHQTLGLPARMLRDDRIVHEVHATGGDLRRISDLFGLSIRGARRYMAILDPPGLDTSR